MSDVSVLEVAIVSHRDRDDLYAELSADDEQWAEVSLDSESHFRLTIFPRASGEPYEFDFEDVLSALTQAKRELAAVEGIEQIPG